MKQNNYLIRIIAPIVLMFCYVILAINFNTLINVLHRITLFHYGKNTKCNFKDSIR